MNKLSIDFENCYGIRKLKHTFDFTTKQTYVVYAPNGSMKTSFAKTLGDITLGKTPSDLMFPSRSSKFIATNEIGDTLTKENMFVIESYRDNFSSEKMTTLLASSDLRGKYDAIHKIIDEQKNNLIKKLKQLSGMTSNIEAEISSTFSKNNLFEVIDAVGINILDQVPKYSNITCSELYNEKVISFLNTSDFKDGLAEYILKFNELLSKSKYLKSGFDHNKANNIQKALKDNGFFKAQHSINLNDINSKQKQEIVTEEAFSILVQREVSDVFNDTDLLSKWSVIDKKLSANTELRDFRDYLLQNKELIPELKNIDVLKKTIWISYFIEQKELYLCLFNAYKNGKSELAEISKKAMEKETEWGDVIGIFNKRFTVPFELIIENQADVILDGKLPNLKFVFHDTEDTGMIEKDEILKVLSNGEKRALYILNIIFEIEARKKSNQETVFIVDDIADSFDYRNKYAIIEYLKEVSEFTNFYQLILTHNFDFYRTISKRFDLQRENKLYAIKQEHEVILSVEKYQDNPFKVWKNKFSNDRNMFIALIPFVRNLLEYTKNEKDSDYLKLTSLLHIKSDTSLIDTDQIFKIFNSVLNLSKPPTSNVLVKDLIYTQADVIMGENIAEQIDLEKKIVLSISIRLKAEEFMINKIDDAIFVSSISSNQTYELFKKYMIKVVEESENKKILGRVNLMTPENIHLNSFMYEPILDMSDKHLRQLYVDVVSLS